MKLRLMAVGAALSLLAPSAAGALESTLTRAGGSASGVARAVEIRVSGDAAALARVRLTARELLSRLDVESHVKAIDEPATSLDEPTPLVIAYVDLRNLSSPGIDIQDGKTRQELTRRQLSDVTSLETGVEAVLHVLYLAVESTLQVGASAPPAAAAAKKPTPTPIRRKSEPRRPRFGLDFGPLLRLSSLGGSRIVPGGGISLEPRTELGRGQAGVLVSGAVHGTSELAFARGTADLRPVQLRVIPTLDWLLSSEASGCFGLGGGLDSFLVEPVQAPEAGKLLEAQSALDPVVTGLIGARVPISGRAFLSALASLDLDLAPTAFVARGMAGTQAILRLPRLRAGFTLALSFSAAGTRRFSPPGLER